VDDVLHFFTSCPRILLAWFYLYTRVAHCLNRVPHLSPLTLLLAWPPFHSAPVSMPWSLLLYHQAGLVLSGGHGGLYLGGLCRRLWMPPPRVGSCPPSSACELSFSSAGGQLGIGSTPPENFCLCSLPPHPSREQSLVGSSLRFPSPKGTICEISLPLTSVKRMKPCPLWRFSLFCGSL
jgi:hypothetical protein